MDVPIASVCFVQAKALAVELYRWAGAAIRPTLEKNLKPVQVCEGGKT